MDNTKLLLMIPKEFNYKLNVHLAKLRLKGVKRTKHDLIIQLAQVGFQHEKIS